VKTTLLALLALLLVGCSQAKFDAYSPVTDLHNTSSQNDVNQYLLTQYKDKWVEELRVVLLDKNGKYITDKVISTGSKNDVHFNFKDIYIYSLENKASKIIVAHNHIGHYFARPSEHDLEALKKLEQFSKTTHIKADFVIVSDNDVQTTNASEKS
jgi:DNA repair protein RadC